MSVQEGDASIRRWGSRKLQNITSLELAEVLITPGHQMYIDIAMRRVKKYAA